MTAVSGTDLHSLLREQGPEGWRGAVNVVYAQELSEAAILAAIKADHSYLSAGPELLLTAKTAAEMTAVIGDTITAAQGAVTVCAT